jgi:cysteinyl-tRNA synthetase
VWAKQNEEAFLADMKAIGANAISRYARATDHIPEVIEQVKALLEKKHAYVIPEDPSTGRAGGIYFDLSTFSDYGKLSGRTSLQADDAVSRIDENEKKKNKGDFCVWKGSFEKGRPGWHIEDTAITQKYFGPQYDIHGGGQDLMFPHHEAEIALMESISGLKPFVRYWMHGGFLVKKSSKMSKSAGNFTTLHDALTLYNPETLRLYFLSAHYRSPLDFSEEILDQAKSAVDRLSQFGLRLFTYQPEKNSLSTLDVSQYRSEFIAEMDKDFNVPGGLGVIFELAKAAHTAMDQKKLSTDEKEQVLAFLADIQKVLGIIKTSTEDLPDKVKTLVGERNIARQAKDYSRADFIRQQIEMLGYALDDTPYGTVVKRPDH